MAKKSKPLPITKSSELVKIMCLLYGKSGMGKTPLSATAEKPLFVDIEKRMLSVKGQDIPRIEVINWKQAKQAIKQLHQYSLKDFKTFIIDSASEIARIRFAQLEANEGSNKFEKYSTLATNIFWIIDELKKMPQDIIFVCKELPISVDNIEKYRPLFPGKKIHPELPYLFDLVLNLRTFIDSEGEEKKFLQTQPNEEYEAKDSTGNLDRAEFEMNMSKIFKKARTFKTKKKGKNKNG